MIINLKTITGKCIMLDVEADATIQSIKTRVKNKEEIPLDHQQLWFKGKEMREGSTLADCDVQDGDSITLLLVRPPMTVTQYQRPPVHLGTPSGNGGKRTQGNESQSGKKTQGNGSNGGGGCC